MNRNWFQFWFAFIAIANVAFIGFLIWAIYSLVNWAVSH